MRSINRGKRPRGSKGSIRRGYIRFRDGPAPCRQIYKDKYCSYKRAEFYEHNISWVIDGSYGNCSSFGRPFSPSSLVLQQHGASGKPAPRAGSSKRETFVSAPPPFADIVSPPERYLPFSSRPCVQRPLALSRQLDARQIDFGGSGVNSYLCSGIVECLI